jgi:hypothetical protein
MTSRAAQVRDAASSIGGRALSGTIRLMSARPAAKPLHPRGDVMTARLERTGTSGPTGCAWLDEPGNDEVLVRLSRAVGLPPGLPDIHGLAIRVPLPGSGHGDLLLASTGLSNLGRFLLTPGRAPYSRPLTTLLPYRSPSGPVVLAARPRAGGDYALAWARPRGPWEGFGTLSLDRPAGADDARVSFDPVLNTVPGLENYGWVRRLREPSYDTARDSRRGQ